MLSVKIKIKIRLLGNSQQINTCSNPTIEALQKGVEYA